MRSLRMILLTLGYDCQKTCVILVPYYNMPVGFVTVEPRQPADRTLLQQSSSHQTVSTTTDPSCCSHDDQLFHCHETWLLQCTILAGCSQQEPAGAWHVLRERYSEEKVMTT